MTKSKITPARIAFRDYGEGFALTMDAHSNLVHVLTGPAYEIIRSAIAWDSNRNVHDPRTVTEAIKLLEISQESAQTDVMLAQDSGTSDRAVNFRTLIEFANNVCLPLTGHLELTQHCNLRCRHCFICHDHAVELTTDEVCQLIADLAASGVFALVLTGGEIFTRKDIEVILNCLDSHCFVVRINTNATLLDEHLIRILADSPAIYQVHVSLYGADAAVHDAITRSPGSFNKTRQNLISLAEAGVRLRINTTVMNSNWLNWQETQSLIADPLGIPIHFDPEIVPRDDGDQSNLIERIDNQKMQTFLNWKASTLGCTENEKTTDSLASYPCRAALSLFAISAKGDLYPCLRMKRVYKKPIGNLLRENFNDIWHKSPRLAQLRHQITQMANNCQGCAEDGF